MNLRQWLVLEDKVQLVLLKLIRAFLTDITATAKLKSCCTGASEMNDSEGSKAGVGSWGDSLRAAKLIGLLEYVRASLILHHVDQYATSANLQIVFDTASNPSWQVL
jgi:hypothetical protein